MSFKIQKSNNKMLTVNQYSAPLEGNRRNATFTILKHLCSVNVRTADKQPPYY